MKTRHRLLKLTVWFIMAAFAAVHAADVSENDILSAARKWIADNAVFKAEAPNALPEKAVQMTDADGKAMPLWRVDLQPAGYLVMSSDDTLPPVVTFNTNGSFDVPEGHPLPYLLKRQGEIFQAELAKPKTRGNELAAENQARWNTLLNRTRANTIFPSEIITPPLLTTKWDQPAPYDYFCPSGDNYLDRAITGCVATAFAQVLKYHEWPPAGQGTASHQDTKGTVTGSFQVDYSFPYDWSLMRDDYKDKWIYSDMLSDYFRPKTPIDRTDLAVSRLMMEMGVFATADYELGATGAYSDDFKVLLASKLKYAANIEYGCISEGYYGYVPQETLYPRIIADMTAGRPALVSGIRYENGQREGHSFVADGLGTMDGLNYCHFNYGWNGEYDGWYLLMDGYDSYVVDTATTNIMPNPIPVFKPMSAEQASAFMLSWDFPKRLTAEAFRLTRTSGSNSSVISSSIAGTARSYDLTGQSGTATYTLEAKVDGNWQAASDSVTITVKANPTPMLTLMCDDELNSVAGRPFTLSVAANNTLQSLSVTCSRPDMVANGSITVSGNGASRTISFTPASGLVGNAILYLTGTDTVGNIVKKTVLLRVLENTLVWITSELFYEANVKSLLTGRLVLLVSGKADDAATTEFVNTVCESSDIKANLLANYELWYDSTLQGINYFGSDHSKRMQPFIAIIEPSNNGTRLRAHSGGMGISEAKAFLDLTLPNFSLTDELLPAGTSQPLELSVLDRNAEIRYRLDFTEPTVSDMLYTGPVSMTDTTTISVRVFKYGLPVSETITKTYTFLQQVAKPVLNAGAVELFSENRLVTASCATTGATLRYTTDGTEPTLSSPVFPNDGVTITDNATILIRAFKEDMTPSECAVSQLYSIGNSTSVDDFDYYINNNDEIEIYGYNGGLEAIIIPATIEGKPVTGFSAWPENVKVIYIPSTLTDPMWLFQFNSLEVLGIDPEHPDYASMDGILFSKDLTELIRCPKGTKLSDYEIPSGVTSIGAEAFMNCNNLRSVRIPDGVTSIGEFAFYDCRGLKSIELPASLTSIGNSAFFDCSSLVSVSIPSGVTSIGERAFDGCSTLTSIDVDAANANYVTADGILYNKALTKLIKSPEGKTGGCEIPSSVTSIASYAFSGCSGLTSISIPSGVTSIGRNAFTGCSGLTSIMIPSGLSSIDIEVFSECSGLTSVTIPSSVTSIGYGAFYGCSGLTSVTIPSSVTSIGDEAFRGCSSLTSVTIPSSVTSILSGAFYGCSSLTSVTIPSRVTAISDHLFSYCSSLTNISIPSNVRKIGQYAFNNCISLADISLPANMTSIEAGAFFRCSSLTSIEIPSNVSYIGNDAFHGCSGLTSVTIPSKMTSIGSSVFESCSGLASITIPSGVTSIGGSAFRNCISLTSIEIPSSVTSIGHEAFRGCSGLTSITIPSGVTTIGNYTFAECTSLTSVSLPSTVTLFEFHAFAGCSSLTSITIPASVTEIGNNSFEGCTSLKELVFNGPVPFFYNKSYPTPIEFSVPAGKGWENWTVPSGVALTIRKAAVADIIINGDDTIVNGGSASFTCTIIWVDGTTSEVMPTWTLSSTEYASVSATGVLTNQNTIATDKTVTLTASYTYDGITKTVSKSIMLEGTSGVRQTLTLESGWNWVSFHVLPESHKVGDVLGKAGFSVNDIIQTNGGMSRFTGSSWLPGSFTVEFGKLYQIYVADTVTVKVSGEKADSSSIPLAIGWNWIGNPTAKDVAPEELVHSGGWKAGDRIQSPNGTVIYTGSKWIPAGFSLNTGKGYQIYTANSGMLSFPVSENNEDEALYAVVDLTGGPNAESYPVRYTSSGPNLAGDTCRTTELWLRKIPAGTFIMGASASEMGHNFRDMAQHQVTLTQDYYIGVFECTQKQWNLVMGNSPSANMGDCRPVEKVSYNNIRGSSSTAGSGWPAYGHVVDASSFMGKLQKKTGLKFDLPTEAQWEYACRAGTTTSLNSGKNLTSTNEDPGLAELGRYSSNQNDGVGGYSPHTTVGSYLPNAWGLYDMHGNVFEWCLDWWGTDTEATTSETNPKGPETGSNRVIRSGGWSSPPGSCRAAARDNSIPRSQSSNIGFRIALHLNEDLYAVVDLSEGPNAASYPVRYTDTAPDLNNDTCRTTELWLRKIPKGTFIMGSPEDEIGHNDGEMQHEVTLTEDYYIGVFECTRRQWELVMGRKPYMEDYEDDSLPVDDVSYDDIRGTNSDLGIGGWPQEGHTVGVTSFMGKLQAKTGLVFDLPTEAQWEYACRAGTTTALNSGKNLTSEEQDANMAELGRYRYNYASEQAGSEYSATIVGSYQPNAWGLYDMHGNVFEWCLDRNTPYDPDSVEDPVGLLNGWYRVLRGGCFAISAAGCRSSSRSGYLGSDSFTGYGFRVACHQKKEIREYSYVVVDLTSEEEVGPWHVRYSLTGPDLSNDKCRTTELWLRKIPKGTFMMGSPEDEVGRASSGEALHEVTLTQDYYIGVFECTQKQWELVMGSNPSEYKGDCRPVEKVSYDMIRGTSTDAGAGWPTYGHKVDDGSFMEMLQGRTWLTFDLPTEAQWEYACRAGTTTALNSGKNLISTEQDVNMNEVGRYGCNKNDGKGGYSQHTKVGSYLPNAWGLYDMHGNVFEWCLDWWGGSTSSTETDPVGPSSGSFRVGRGGYWGSDARYCRSAFSGTSRPSYNNNYNGFRIVWLP